MKIRYCSAPCGSGKTHHAVLPLVHFWPNKAGWDLLIDEELQVLLHQAHQLPQTHRLMTEHVSIHPINGSYGRVESDDADELEEMARNRMDDDIIGFWLRPAAQS